MSVSIRVLPQLNRFLEAGSVFSGCIAGSARGAPEHKSPLFFPPLFKTIFIYCEYSMRQPLKQYPRYDILLAFFMIFV